MFFNQTPTVSTSQLSQTGAGIVTGAIYADDLDGDSLNASYGGGAYGNVSVNYDGSYTYTPYSTSSSTGFVDTFQLTITDAGNGFHIHGLGGLLNLLTFGLLGSSGHETTISVPVNVAPFKPNSAPTATVTIRSTDPTTGAVTGAISATDPNGDQLTYSAPAVTSKGVVSITRDGTFTYTPSAYARHNAASTSSSAKTDTFSVSVSDGFGGVATVPITVTITPANAVPVVGTSVAGRPDVSTGVVIGAVSAIDADNDFLSYTGSTTTAAGKVTVYSNGGFQFTPTSTAREAATATTTDSFTITASDGYGGVVAIPVTVRILPVPVVSQVIPNLATGVVTGSIAAPNFTSGPLNYTAPSATPKGQLLIDSGTGTFTYTPYLAARHGAASTSATSGDKTDSFDVTITDDQGEIVYKVPITITLRPQNTAPTGSFIVSGTDPSTGVITGTVRGLDGDSDTLIYSGSSLTAEGRVVIDAKAGTFTYTPVARVDTVTSMIAGFNSPAAIAFSSNGSRAYVANNKGNSISVVDTATKAIVATISGLTTPTDLAVTPDGQRVYVVGKNSVFVLDTSTNSVTGTISGLYAPAGSSPTPKSVAISPDGTIAYVLNSTNALSVVDTTTNQVVDVISAGSYTSVTFSPDGKRAYLGGALSSAMVDTATNQRVSSVSGGGGVVFSPAGDRFYMVAYDGGVIGRTATGSSLGAGTSSSAARALGVSRDGSIVYGLGTKGEILLFDAANATLLGTAKYACAGCGTSATVGTIYPRGIAVSPDGTTVYAVNPVNGTISVVTGWVGQTTDTFNVTINDGHGDTATVPITVSFTG